MLKKVVALVLGTVAIVPPSGCDPWQACSYLEGLCPYLPPELCDLLKEICSMPHIL